VSKILKNNTGSPQLITDVGQTVAASGQLTINPQDYLLYAQSGDLVSLIGDATLTVNDGSADLNISDGIDLIKGIFPKPIAIVDSDNSSSTNLLADAQFVGEWFDTLNYGICSVCVYASHDSASGGLKIEWSNDGVDVHSDDTFTVPANTGKQFSFGNLFRYLRVTYTNGGTDQTGFSLQTLQRPMPVKPSSHRIEDSISDDDDAELQKSVITGKTQTQGYKNVALDDNARIIISGTAELVDPLPSLDVVSQAVISANTARYTVQSIATKTALKFFTLGGRTLGEATIARYVDATTELLPGGGFNSSGDVALWTSTGQANLLNGTPSYSTAQAFEGSGSLLLDHNDSDANKFLEMTYTWASAQNLSAWRYVSAHFYNSPEKIENKLRTIQIRLRSGTAIRVYQLSGPRNTAPFGNVGWIELKAQLEIPTAIAGTGTFDITAVDAISLRMFDENHNKALAYWDNVHFAGAITSIAKIYTPGQTTALVFDPVKIFEAGESLLIITKNNGTVQAEFQTTVSGVDIS
jgi:hypothetical protein